MEIHLGFYFQIFFSIFLSGALLLVILACGKSVSPSYSFSSPFECGFRPSLNSRGPFSLQFFLLGLVFLIFDIELIFLFPFQFSSISYSYLSLQSMFLFMGFLLAGLGVEWSQASLEWSK